MLKYTRTSMSSIFSLIQYNETMYERSELCTSTFYDQMAASPHSHKFLT